MKIQNLFYERKLSQVFDLKGSTRNRRVAASGPGEVLMDENLVEISLKSPLYIREASKRMLSEAIDNDTQFLANLNVMDYSLVVGVDSVNQELVVGIVDYIRTFTWDKKLENIVKDSSLLGGKSFKSFRCIVIVMKPLR
jgi:1-phosphatidylinositol-3-phosphate 5-kinase